MKLRKSIKIRCDQGNMLVLLVVLLLCMTLLAGASVTLAQTQWNMARFSRQTSNSYYLARSGAEKMIDSMNKELAAELPRLMEEASNSTRTKMLEAKDSKDGISYTIENEDPYSGRYIGREYENEYEVKLKELIYDHIVTNFHHSMSYKAYSDTKGNEPITITANLYHRQSITGVPDDIKPIVQQLTPEEDVGVSSEDVLAVEVVARAQKDSKTSLTKARVVGTISLNQMMDNKEQLLEEYEWALDEHGKGVYPEALQSAVISFGDFLVSGGNSAKIQGDIHVKGTIKKAIDAQYYTKTFPEPDEWGGIIVSNKGELEVKGSAFVVSNIQTLNSYGKETLENKIIIEKDAIANTIGIHDSYYAGHADNIAPWNHYVKNNSITIGQNAYIDNDIRIDRYVDQGKIHITGSVFGISDRDPDGKEIGSNIIVDPNKSSGVFSMGKDSQVTMGRAFIAGQPFINFGDGNGYHRLHESAGEPFEDVYYLEKYRKEYGDDATYIDELKDLINKQKINITDVYDSKPYAYAPARISATIGTNTIGYSYDVKKGTSPMEDQNIARAIFYEGSIGALPTDWKSRLARRSDWDEPILGTSAKWESVIKDPWDFYNGENSFNKSYIPKDITFEYGNMLGYKGLQGYMLAKRGVFYDTFRQTTGITKYKPSLRELDDLVNVSLFTETNDWSYNNPIYVTSGHQIIDISQFESIPTAIISRDNSELELIASSTEKVFNGVIITPGKVKIAASIEVNGVIIAGNESVGISTTREGVQRGDYAGVEILAQGVKINYDKDQILKIRCMNKSLQRKLYDCLKITNYSSVNATALKGKEQEKIDSIMGTDSKRIIRLSKSSVVSSKQGGLQFVMKSLRKL